MDIFNSLAGLRKEPDGSYSFCCSKKDCPNITLNADGGATITEPATGAVVVFDKDQFALLGNVAALSAFQHASRIAEG